MTLRLDERLSALVLPRALALIGQPSGRMLAELMAVERLSPDELAELQWKRLKALIEHAWAHVPFYRTMFDKLGIRPADIRDREDYARLPFTDRDSLVHHESELLADTFDPRALKVVHTGGSTGTAARVHQNLDYYHWGASAFQRNLRWIGFEPGERQAWFTRPGVTTLSRRIRLAIERKWVVGVTVHSPVVLAEWARGVLRRQPRLIYGYATAIDALAEYALEHSIRFPSVRHVMTSSETLTDQMRARISEAFDAPVYNQYGCTEVYAIASECEHGNMHVNSDLNHVELVPLKDPSGATQLEVVATPLFQLAQPLLRFRTGDEVDSLAAGPCPCGRPFPLMGPVAGRVDDILEFSGGTRISGMLLERLVRRIHGVAHFQVQQTSRDSLRVLIVPNHEYGARTQAEFEELRQHFAEQAGVAIDISPVLVDQIPVTRSGKQKSIVRLDEEAPLSERS